MQTPNLLRHLYQAKYTRAYFVLSCLYGLSTLIVPFATQLLVNNLSMGGFWTNTYTFLLLIGTALTFALFVKYLQFVLLELIQRNLYFVGITRWQRRAKQSQFNSPYLFEVFAMLKSFASLVSDGMDLILRSFFGTLALAFIHPAFLVFGFLILFCGTVIRWQGRDAVRTSKNESNEKYEYFYGIKRRATKKNRELALQFLQARDIHFEIVKRQTMTLYASVLVLQMIMLSWGIYLIQVNQLSIGQFVSAEIIVSGIAISCMGIPKMLRNAYDFETSCSKIEHPETRAYAKAA